MNIRTTPEQTALLITCLLHRSGSKRARISQKTMKLLSQRKRIHASFLIDVQEQCVEFGTTLVELPSGAFGVFPSAILEGASSLTAKSQFSEEELRSIRKGHIDFEALEAEILDEVLDDIEDDV